MKKHQIVLMKIKQFFEFFKDVIFITCVVLFGIFVITISSIDYYIAKKKKR